MNRRLRCFFLFLCVWEMASHLSKPQKEEPRSSSRNMGVLLRQGMTAQVALAGLGNRILWVVSKLFTHLFLANVFLRFVSSVSPFKCAWFNYEPLASQCSKGKHAFTIAFFFHWYACIFPMIEIAFRFSSLRLIFVLSMNSNNHLFPWVLKISHTLFRLFCPTLIFLRSAVVGVENKRAKRFPLDEEALNPLAVFHRGPAQV